MNVSIRVLNVSHASVGHILDTQDVDSALKSWRQLKSQDVD